MDKYEEMLKRADEKYHFSELEKDKIIRLLDYCHANDVRWTLRRMFEVYFMCSAMPVWRLQPVIVMISVQDMAVLIARQQMMRNF